MCSSITKFIFTLCLETTNLNKPQFKKYRLEVVFVTFFVVVAVSREGPHCVTLAGLGLSVFLSASRLSFQVCPTVFPLGSAQGSSVYQTWYQICAGSDSCVWVPVHDCGGTMCPLGSLGQEQSWPQICCTLVSF